jgi:predicted DNA-binding protein with PD1-like motif
MGEYNELAGSSNLVLGEPVVTFETIRLHPNQDLKLEILDYVERRGIKAGFIASGMGSLTKAALRYPYQHGDDFNTVEGEFEIVALTGTLGQGRQDGCHIHIALTKADGVAFGGHLQPGCKICSTAEIVIGIFDNIRFEREFDEESGFPELAIYPDGDDSET